MLTFETLRTVNVKRCEDSFHSVDIWKPWEWSNAMAGEVGELAAEVLALVALIAASAGAVANTTKKMARVWPANMFKQAWNKPEDQRMEDLREKLKREIGDVLIYADLLAASQNLTLDECVQTAFNEKSEELGLAHRL
jgi:NTP pyrophosphatase (non-canonical NTP hydrolase)